MLEDLQSLLYAIDLLKPFTQGYADLSYLLLRDHGLLLTLLGSEVREQPVGFLLEVDGFGVISLLKMCLRQLEVGSADLVRLVTELVLVQFPHLGQEVHCCVEILKSLVHMGHGNIDQTVRMVVFTHDLPIHLK